MMHKSFKLINLFAYILRFDSRTKVNFKDTGVAKKFFFKVLKLHSVNNLEYNTKYLTIVTAFFCIIIEKILTIKYSHLILMNII